MGERRDGMKGEREEERGIVVDHESKWRGK